LALLLDNDIIPMLNDPAINSFFKEKESFMQLIKNMGFTEIGEFRDYIEEGLSHKTSNILLEDGFCDMELEVYEAFNKAHQEVSKEITGEMMDVEWGGVYRSMIDAMHFSLNQKFIKIF
jgi:hypothetical protein